MAMTNEEALHAVSGLRTEAALQAGFAALSFRGELSDMLDGAASIIAALIARNAELEAVLQRALPTVEHMYHTSPDTDGSLWRDVIACRQALQATPEESA